MSRWSNAFNLLRPFSSEYGKRIRQNQQRIKGNNHARMLTQYWSVRPGPAVAHLFESNEDEEVTFPLNICAISSGENDKLEGNVTQKKYMVKPTKPLMTPHVKN
mmetsp:Transcript_76819/g.151996  ORF Transcript_76819/g.151996 Transcript_76819/m.151996 type:complete len:104 (-) Transcript_76819:96-407(-)